MEDCTGQKPVITMYHIILLILDDSGRLVDTMSTLLVFTSSIVAFNFIILLNCMEDDPAHHVWVYTTL
jgi:hypothetical protein